MERHGDEIHLDTTEARSGVTNHGVRYVLMFSMAMAIVILSLIWITGAYLSRDTVSKPFHYEGVAAESR